MTVALALCNQNAPGLPGLFSLATRARLVTQWPHAGMVVNGVLMHANLANGLHASSFAGGPGWDLISLPDASGPLVLEQFERYKGAQYDAISQLAFVLPWRISDSARMYCYEWCYLAMTGQNPHWHMTPEQLLFAASRINEVKSA